MGFAISSDTDKYCLHSKKDVLSSFAKATEDTLSCAKVGHR